MARLRKFLPSLTTHNIETTYAEGRDYDTPQIQ